MRLSPPPVHHPARDRMVLAATAFLLVLSVGVAVVLSGQWREAARADEQRAFQAQAADVSAAVGGSVRRVVDFTQAIRATVASNPQITQASFQEMVNSVGFFARYPGAVGLGYDAFVTDEELPAFAARELADPAQAGLPTTRYQVVPAGRRPLYCLMRVAVAGPGQPGMPLGFDFCGASDLGAYASTSFRSRILAARDTGLTTAHSLDRVQGGFALMAPVYKSGAPVTTVAQRRAAALGVVIAAFNGADMIADGGGARDGLLTEVGHVNPDGERLALASSGSAAVGGSARTATVLADGEWTIRIAGAIPSSGWSIQARYQGLLSVGLLISLLLVSVMTVLVQGRRRALQLVDRKTGELRYRALHDSLTGLPNRALILDRVELALARTHRSNAPIALMFLDLDGFKGVNDTFGHAAGDTLLRSVAGRLSVAVRASDTVGRLGGDEFVVLLEGDSLDAGVAAVAQRLLDVLSEPLPVGGSTELRLAVRASIGIASGTRGTAEEMLRDADVALYEAKAAGKGCFVVFAPEMQRAVQERLELEMDLHDALARDELELVYQPTVALGSGAFTGVEALLRWRHPTRGNVMPLDFIPIAEESGMIVDIGRWVLLTACKQAACWSSAGVDVDVSVNVSACQLERGKEFLGHVREALAASGLPASRLVLEITESVLMRDAETATGRLRALKELGVRIAIDDFGTGYSSLAYLRQFPIDTLKIDRSFIKEMQSTESQALIHTFVQLGRNLGLETLAEGIEDATQLAHLQQQGCDSGQGYLFAKPMAPEALEPLLRAHWRPPQSHRLDGRPRALVGAATAEAVDRRG